MTNTRKVFLTYDEQIKLLQSRGLTIMDKEMAKHYLEYFGYFELINGYKDLFLKRRQPEEYRSNVTFSDFVGLYMFDYNLRSDLLSALYLVEKSLKSTISYIFSKKFGENHNTYLSPTSFDERPHKAANVATTIDTLNDLINSNYHKGNSTICHYMDHHGYIPLWVLFTVATFGNISVFYANLKDSERDKISAHYHLSSNGLRTMMYLLTHARNACAHGHRIYTFGSDYKRPITIPQNNLHTYLEIPDTEGRCDILAVLICCYYLLPNNSFKYLASKIQNDLEKIKHERFYSGVLNKTNLRNKYLSKLLK